MKSIFDRFINANPAMFVFFAAVGSLCCIISKNENFFDFANYHYYNAFAFLNDRMNHDIVPASVNTFFNPLLDLPLYLIIRYFNDNLTAAYALQGLWFGFLLFAFFKIASLFFDLRTREGRVFVLLACAIAATGPMTWFQAGSSTNEIQVAFFVLTGLYLLLKMIKYRQLQNKYTFLLSGLILGAVLGLKPTAVTAAVAAGIALIICRRHLKRPLLFILFFAGGGLAGFLLTNGWWMYKLYSLYGNPFFPFFNGIFHSPYFDDFNYSDRRFIPPLKLALFCPYLSKVSHYCHAGTYFTDLRFPLYYSLVVGAAVWLVCRPRRLKAFFLGRRAWFMLFVFMLLNYVLWLTFFAIQHYLVVWEMLGALLTIKFISLYRPRQSNVKFILYYTAATILCGILLITPFIDGGFGNRRSDNKMIDVSPVVLPPGTLLKLYNLPLAGIIPLWAQNNDFRALGYMQFFDDLHMRGSDLAERGKFREMRDEIEKTHTGPVVVLFRMPVQKAPFSIIMRAMAPELNGKNCHILPSSFAPIFSQHIYVCVPKELENFIFGQKTHFEPAR